MKILYAIQATGNGHISRAVELLPYLKRHGSVDVFLSGSNSSLKMPFPVKYTGKGVSLFYGNTGGLNYIKMLQSFAPVRVVKEAMQLPIENYDIVLNDFESITSLACKLKKVNSIQFGHQASFHSANTPRPENKDLIGEMVLKNYATSSVNIGLHFKQYDNFIYSPVIKETILQAHPINNGHITVYLSHYSDDVIKEQLFKVKDVHFHVFSKNVNSITMERNITFVPVSNILFTRSLIESDGVITGAGFETPAEALYLRKKLMCLPIKGQYEQLCNAEALKAFNVPIIDEIDNSFSFKIKQWLNALPSKPLYLSNTTEQIVETVIQKGIEIKSGKTNSPEPLIFQPNLVPSIV